MDQIFVLGDMKNLKEQLRNACLVKIYPQFDPTSILYKITMRLFVAFLIVSIASAFQPRHDYYYRSYKTQPYKSYSTKTYDNDTGVAGFIVFIIFTLIIGLAIYFLCKKCRQGRQPAPASYYPPVQNYAVPQNYSPAYYQQYPNAYPPPNPNYQYPSNAPYSSPNVAYNSQIPSNWQGPDYFAASKLKQNCGFCRTFSKYGEQPRIMLSCPERHAFHLFCINQHRAGANRMGSASYVTNTCPVCNHLVNEKVRLYCMICKLRNVEVDLKEFSDQHDVVDVTRLLGQFGEYCLECRRM